MIDAFGRNIDYLRLAVTDRCTLHCVYCSPGPGFRQLPRSRILTYEEMEKLAVLLVSEGIRKIRLTGGEPLLRKGVLAFARRLSGIPGLERLAMTTNGLLLAEKARECADSGIQSVNVSLDAVHRDKYALVTGSDELPRVLEGIDAALDAGLELKINSVIVGGLNEDQIIPLARLAQTAPVQVRFIEKMPLDRTRELKTQFVPFGSILARLRSVFTLRQVTNGPGLSALFGIHGYMGQVGIIAPVSKPFCRSCNRLRLTPDGRLKTCLLSESELDLAGPLRAGIAEAELTRLVESALAEKPASHRLSEPDGITPRGRGMRLIGG